MQNALVRAHVPQSPHALPTHGASQPPVSSTAFGDSWTDRTYDLGVITIESTSAGITSIAVMPGLHTSNPSFRSQLTATSTRNYMELVAGEYLVEVELYVSESRDRIHAVCLVSNLRRSQWFGRCAGEKEAIVAPAGSYLHTLYGANGDDVCQQLGGYVVPLALRGRDERQCRMVSKSSAMGATPVVPKSRGYFNLAPIHVRAVVVSVGDALNDVWILDANQYNRHLAVRASPLPAGIFLLVLVEHEQITGLRTSVTSSGIQSIQLVTTLRTTEWFGPAPGENTTVEYRSIKDQPRATHIGGIFGMEAQSPQSIKSIGVIFYKR